MWRQQLQPGQTVMLPAASSSVAIAASQVAKQCGAITIGTTTSPEKIDKLNDLKAAKFDHIVLTTGDKQPWWRTVKKITGGKGVDVIFDPVAAGEVLHHEIRLLAKGGTLWVYGLLGQPDTVDVSPLIRKDAAIRGWLLNAIAHTPAEVEGYRFILEQVSTGAFQLPIAGSFALEDIRQAHEEMESGGHIGKFILRP